MDLGALLDSRRQRNQKYFLQIKDKMQELGYRWSWQQLRTHWKNLKTKYKIGSKQQRGPGSKKKGQPKSQKNFGSFPKEPRFPKKSQQQDPRPPIIKVGPARQLPAPLHILKGQPRKLEEQRTKWCAAAAAAKATCATPMSDDRRQWRNHRAQSPRPQVPARFSIAN
ncbi:hypothetical protein HPB48_009931 [Haemaphysalis longicornis]|uniref:Myb/SANT-like DNA-binding domain-containing protein n=1 Tax=Haemaphysalis longicornis TaxID=44386 RepID=A0A9J6GIM6_HAELO|nr:hypothetical protein HPB48_009931 [Haemaphysalis longicornis]